MINKKILFFTILSFLNAKDINISIMDILPHYKHAQKNIDNKIGQMLMLGFSGTQVNANSKICKSINKYNIGGVILFSKNIKSPTQLKNLTKALQKCSPSHNLLISIDQEGGKVQRLKANNGFYGKYPSAKTISTLNTKQINYYYSKMAKELYSYGINFNLAPVVDLDINNKNYIIHKLGRSFSGNPMLVTKDASIFINSMRHYGIVTSLKHFPGHGSSLGDTHKGFVDVTNRWKETELQPYKELIQRGLVDTIMVAHIFNKRIDSNYPASLSYKTIHLLRSKLGYNGVVITDDLQMRAISNLRSQEKTIMLSINAGNDILLFGNQVNKNSILTADKYISIVKKLIKENKIKSSTIINAYNRIQQLKINYNPRRKNAPK